MNYRDLVDEFASQVEYPMTMSQIAALRRFTVWLDTQRSPTIRGADSQALELLREIMPNLAILDEPEIDEWIARAKAVLESV